MATRRVDAPGEIERTGELGSEGGSYADWTQMLRKARGENADVAPYRSPALSTALIGIIVFLLLLLAWFGLSLSELMTEQ
jgi:hypothetical protein